MSQLANLSTVKTHQQSSLNIPFQSEPDTVSIITDANNASMSVSGQGSKKTTEVNNNESDTDFIVISDFMVTSEQNDEATDIKTADFNGTVSSRTQTSAISAGSVAASESDHVMLGDKKVPISAFGNAAGMLILLNIMGEGTTHLLQLNGDLSSAISESLNLQVDAQVQKNIDSINEAVKNAQHNAQSQGACAIAMDVILIAAGVLTAVATAGAMSGVAVVATAVTVAKLATDIAGTVQASQGNLQGANKTLQIGEYLGYVATALMVFIGIANIIGSMGSIVEAGIEGGAVAAENGALVSEELGSGAEAAAEGSATAGSQAAEEGTAVAETTLKTAAETAENASETMVKTVVDTAENTSETLAETAAGATDDGAQAAAETAGKASSESEIEEAKQALAKVKEQARLAQKGIDVFQLTSAVSMTSQETISKVFSAIMAKENAELAVSTQAYNMVMQMLNMVLNDVVRKEKENADENARQSNQFKHAATGATEAMVSSAKNIGGAAAAA